MIADRALWRRARDAFDTLVELDPGARPARLAELGRTDPELGAAVERLLAADDSAEATLRDYEFAAPHAPPAASADAHDGDDHQRDPLGVVGCIVSHFRVTHYLAAGGMGVVYRAEDLQLGRVVALKFPLPHQPVGHAAAERFMNEARSAAALDHPNLCTVHEIGEGEHGVFLAMPLYAGETLKARLARDGPLSLDAALDVAMQVAAGLAAAHAAGIVHRDLKPGNVMILPDGAVKVLDFGLAKIRDVDLTRSRMTLGTIGYVAPEQIRGDPADARADLWALGVLLYEMLTGAPPFAGEHEMAVLHAVLHAEATRPSAARPELAPPVDDVILTLLRKDPGERHPSADALLADLAALRRGAPLAPAPFRRRRVPRRTLRTAVAMLALASVAGTGWAVARRRAAAPTAGVPPAPAWVGDTVVVTTGAELAAVLVPANAGRRVRLRAGTYHLDRPLTVPDGMTLEGAGVMRVDATGLPAGFVDATRTTLRMTASAGGDVLTLGDGVTVRNVEIEDLAGRSGNVVSVTSRAPRDRVAATLAEVVIVNPNPLAIGAGGALGRALSVVAANPNLGADPAPHEGAAVTVRMTRSVIRSPAGGGGLFAYSFASGSRVVVDVARSVIGGGSEANGGVSRPDAVHDSEVHVASRGNLYRNEWPDPCAAPLLGWNVTGGSGAPIPILVPQTARNTLRFHSLDDRIERFTTGVLATGSRRFFAAPLNAAPTDNHVDLRLVGTRISTPACAAPGATANTGGVPAHQRVVADLRLAGAYVEAGALDPGRRNSVRAEVRGVTGSGRRANAYAHAADAAGALPPRAAGGPDRGNRLEIVGDARTFRRENRGLVPSPDAAFFVPPRGATAAREPSGTAIPRDGVHPPLRRSP